MHNTHLHQFEKIECFYTRSNYCCKRRSIPGHTGPGNQCPYNITFDYSGNVYYGSQHYGYGVKKFDIQTMTQSEFIGTSEFTPRNENNYVFGIVFDNSWNGYLIHSPQ